MEKQKGTHRLVQLALLVAVELVMTYTPLGYLHVGPLSITFLMVPVVLGSILAGPSAGALLGGVFGLTSFAQCFGAEAFGCLLYTSNEWLLLSQHPGCLCNSTSFSTCLLYTSRCV